MENRVRPDIGTNRREGIWSSLRVPKGAAGDGKASGYGLIVFVVGGSVAVATGDFPEVAVTAGQMFLIPPHTAYRGQALEKTQLMACRFEPEMLLRKDLFVNDLMPYSKEDPGGVYLLPVHRLIRSHLTLTGIYMRAGMDSDVFFDIKKQELFHLLFSLCHPRELALFFHPVLGDDLPFRIFVVNNWQKVKTVQQLAALAGYSASGFIKKFVRHFNESPYRWMSQQKAGLILREINSGRVPLKEIAQKYRFSSYQHFSEFCKARYGVSPTKSIKMEGAG